MIENEQNNREHIAGWLRLHLTDQVGAITFARLLKHFGGVEQALEASAGHLASVPGIGVKTARRITESRDNVDIEAELDLADELGVRTRTLIRSAPAAADEIIRTADELEADLLVVGATLRKLDGRPFLGHRVEEMLERATPTVVVAIVPQ